MAKLSDLKALVDAARGGAAPRDRIRGATAAAKPRHPPRHPVGGKREADVRRTLAAGKHANGDIDIARAFADVTRLPPGNRAAAPRPRPSTIPRFSLADERDALELSKYGAEPAPHAWDVGQETEGEQTFVRVQRGGSFSDQQVTVGPMNAHEAVITSGLAAGAVVERHAGAPRGSR